MASSDPVRTENHSPVPPGSRTVRPRKRSTKFLPVVAIGREEFLAEDDAIPRTGTLTELLEMLPEMPPTLFCKNGAADFIAELTSVYLLRYPDTWQWHVTEHGRNMGAPSGITRATRVSAAVHHFGWKHRGGKHSHRIIDPVTIYGNRLDTIWPGEVSVVDDPLWREMVKLLKWGTALRDFCVDNNINVRPTLGSIAAQFLTDPRFYPNKRRKVPAFTNQRVRENLPGNHYYLNVRPDPSNDFRAHYLDQHRSHHYHARTVPLPDSDHCFAFGRFGDLAESSLAVNKQFIGMYCLDLIPPDRQVPFDWMKNVGKKIERAFVYSNELSHLLDMGYRVHNVRAAWGSLKRDTGLPKYAAWASDQLDSRGDLPWLKPLLLATYGVLATRPMNRQSVFRLAKRGTPITVRTGRRELNGLFIESPQKLEPGVAHVIQRGMIEAACRSESIGLAQWLDHLGYTVLSIYADAVMVEVDDDKPMPILPEPWRYKRTLNHLQFINQQAFQSDGMTKLPGVGREIMPYRQHRKPGHAPRLVQYEALTNRPVQTSRRI